MKIQKNKSLKKYTTYKIGGPADFFIEAKTEEDIIQATDWARKKKIPFVIIGNASNVLVNDNGFRGLVIKISYNDCDLNEDTITCGTGALLPTISSLAVKSGLSGAEFLSAIPGTLGGAIVGNAGVGEESIKTILESAKIIEENGNIRNVTPDYFDFDYRESKLKNNKETIIEATLKLVPKNKEKIKKKIEKMTKKRINQPKGNSAGSVFRNPENKKAGKLIEGSGLKGQREKNAEISKEHANFIINKGGASFNNVKELISLAEKKVKDKFKIKLKREIRILGEKGWE